MIPEEIVSNIEAQIGIHLEGFFIPEWAETSQCRLFIEEANGCPLVFLEHPDGANRVWNTDKKTWERR